MNIKGDYNQDCSLGIGVSPKSLSRLEIFIGIKIRDEGTLLLLCVI